MFESQREDQNIGDIAQLVERPLCTQVALTTSRAVGPGFDFPCLHQVYGRPTQWLAMGAVLKTAEVEIPFGDRSPSLPPRLYGKICPCDGIVDMLALEASAL